MGRHAKKRTKRFGSSSPSQDRDFNGAAYGYPMMPFSRASPLLPLGSYPNLSSAGRQARIPDQSSQALLPQENASQNPAQETKRGRNQQASAAADSNDIAALRKKVKKFPSGSEPMPQYKFVGQMSYEDLRSGICSMEPNISVASLRLGGSVDHFVSHFFFLLFCFSFVFLFLTSN